MKTLITILARANSKGLPNKHLLQFNGKPLIEWTIQQAKDYVLLNDADIVVATDSMEILNLAGSLGVCATVRNPRYATDKAGKVDAIRDLLENAESKLLKEYNCIIDLDATNPCRTIEDIEESFKIFREKQPKTLFSVTKSKKNPYFNQVFYSKDYTRYFRAIEREMQVRFGEIDFIWDGGGGRSLLRRQDAPQVYDLNSNIYIYSTDWLKDKNNKSVVTDESEIYLMSDWTYCDIDNKICFQVAEFLHNKYILKKEGNVQLKKQDCFSSGWHGPDRVCGHGCATQARGIYFND